MDDGRERHLTREERELFLPDAPGGGKPPAELRRHVQGCERCHHEVEALRSLHAALAALPRLDPRPGFADAVMARVRLPVPWYVRVRDLVTGHWLSISLAVGLVAATAGAGAWWLTSQPELTLGGLLGFTLHRLTALFWSSVVAAGRVVWESGLPELVRSAGSHVGLRSALAGMAALVVASLLTTLAMAKMVAPGWNLVRTRRS